MSVVFSHAYFSMYVSVSVSVPDHGGLLVERVRDVRGGAGGRSGAGHLLSVLHPRHGHRGSPAQERGAGR